MPTDKINIMIVDDEDQFLESMRKRLVARDFNVVAVNRGEKALVAAREQPLDVAIVDLKMPGMDGEETLKALKNEHEWLEIVILTGHGSFESAMDLTKDGVYFYMQKPCELHVLLEVLTQALKRRVMRKRDMGKEAMQELLQTAQEHGPMAVLEELRELDREQ